MQFEGVLTSVRSMKGTAGMVYKNLCTGEECAYQADAPMIAASVIKIPVMIEAFAQMADGRLDAQERFVLKEEDKMPSCGALNMLHEGIELTALDMIRLMIILSDNTATNLLIRRLGIEQVNHTMEALGLQKTRLRRLLFDSARSAQGIQNTVTAREIARLLEMLYRGEVIGERASAQMIDILKEQRLNGKIPFFLHAQGIACAHKTGEDTGITHDCGIVYAREPFVLCFCGQEVDVPAFERVMQDAARAFCER